LHGNDSFTKYLTNSRPRLDIRDRPKPSPLAGEAVMKRTLIELAATATIALATVAVPSNADAGHRGGHVAAGVAAGIIGGAIIGSALAPRPYYYGPPPAVVYEDEPVCRIVKERVWVEGYGYRTRRAEICD
jgi:hypothetical protein